jgi:hypothetical protein
LKKVFYFSISANPWQRSAMLDSAIEKAKNEDNEVSFYQVYKSEDSSVDLPFASYLDYKLARYQDNRMRSALAERGVSLDEFDLLAPNASRIPNEKALEIGYEETIVKTRDSKPCRTHCAELIYHYGQTHQLVYEAAIRFLSLHRPDLVYIFNGRFYREKAIWRAAEDLGITVNFIERFSPAWVDRYFEFENAVHSIKYRCEIMMEFWDNYRATHGENLALSISDSWFANRTLGVGQSFTKDQSESFSRDKGNKKLITFFHSSEDELFSTDLGSNTWNDQIAFLRELHTELSKMDAFHLLIRVHPNLRHKSSREIQRWKIFQKELNQPNVTFVMHDSSVRTYDILRESDFVITFGSTIGVEASFAGKPSLLVSRAFHESLGVVLPIGNLVDLISILNDGVSQSILSKMKDSTRLYGLFHAIGGKSFQNLEHKTDKAQDPSFYFEKYKVGSMKVLSVIRRFEGALKKSRFSRLELDCSCIDGV